MEEEEGVVGVVGEMGEGGGREELVAEGERKSREEEEVVMGRVVAVEGLELGSRSGTGREEEEREGEERSDQDASEGKVRSSREGSSETHATSDHECRVASESRCSRF